MKMQLPQAQQEQFSKACKGHQISNILSTETRSR
jgi:hypothetical protein